MPFGVYDALDQRTMGVPPCNGSQSSGCDAVGNLQTLHLPNAVTNTWAYNALNRLTNLTVTAASGTLASFAYKLAPAGNRTNLSETVNAASRTFSWQYDPLYRLTNETITGTAPTGGISYRYDTVGNRTNRTSTVSGLTNQTFSYTSNDRLTSDSYDANGSTTNSAGNTYRYDVQGRLTNAVVGGTSITYVYDGDGNRVRKIVGTTTNSYLVCRQNLTGYAQVLEESVNGTLSKVYAYGLDLISQRDVGGSTYYFGQDGLGSTRLLTTTNATVANAFTYDAFGTLIASNAASQTDYLFTGEQRDPNLGFYYLRARYLNPGTGRFWTRDTYAGSIFDPPSLHRYTYVHNDPVNGTDPSGEFFTVRASLIAISIAIVVASVSYVGYQLLTSRGVQALRVGNDLISNSRKATDADIQWIESGFAKIGSSDLNRARDAIRDGTTEVYIVEREGAQHGAHIAILKGKIFIPQSRMRQGADVAAFFAFGEFQHDTIGNNLSEREAQEQLDRIIKALKPPYNAWKFKHGQ